MLVAIGLLVLAIVLLLVLLVRKRRVKAAQAAAAQEEAAASAAPAPPGASPDNVVTIDFTSPGQALRLRGTFRRGLRNLRRHLGRDALYRLPWYLLVGETASGKSDLLGRAGLSLPLGEPREGPDEGAGCSFWFLDGGVVLDVAGDFLLGEGGSNAAGWKQLLGLLQAERVERPLDGIILAVSAAGLLADGPAAVTGKADEMCRKLREAQRELGVCFPVYVLVTGCDRIPGFGSLFREVPEPAQGEIFGWSSPYGLDAPFRPEWVDEAFQTVGASLKKVQLCVLGERIQIDEPDGVFLFPAEVQALRDPLRVLLSQIFRASTFTEPLALRGVYFCGELHGAEIEAQSQPAPAPALLASGWAASSWRDASSRVLFLRDLFARKIFPERGLARFASRNTTGRSRLVRIAQIALVVFTLVTSLGVWWSYTRLARREPGLRAFLLQTSRDLEETRERRAAGEDLTEPYLEEKSLRFLGGLAGIDASPYRSVFLPSSWFSPLHSGFRHAFTIGYTEMVFNALSLQLQHKTADLISKSRPSRLEERLPLTDDLADLASLGSRAGSGVSGEEPVAVPEEAAAMVEEEGFGEDLDDSEVISLAAPEILPVEGTPEVLALREYANQLTELSRKARTYNNLRETRDLHELADLVQYLFGASVPPGFFERSGAYQRALRQVAYKPFDSKPYLSEASLTASLLADQLFERLYHRNAVTFYVQKLQEDLDQVGQAAEGNISQSRLLREISTVAEQTEQALARPEVAWMSSPTFALGQPFEKTLESVRGCELLGPVVEHEIRQKGEAATLALQQELAGYQTVYTGPLLRRDAPGRAWKLSPAVLLLRNALLDLLNESFMHLRSRRTLQVDVARGTRLTWDTRQLQEAVQLYDPYKAFVEGGLRRFPPALRDPLQRSARNRLSARLMEQVAEAQRFSAVAGGGDTFLEREIQAEVANFRAAGQPLSDLISIFDRIDSPQDHDLLERITLAQAQGILLSVDRLLASESLYVPKGGGFDWWEGGRTVAFEAFGVADGEELAAYLEAQRSRLTQIADQYADPALRVLASSPRNADLRRLVNKWNAIIAELRKHDSKKPGNSVTALEEWITQLPQIDTRSCLRTLAPRRLDDRPPDWFIEVRASLRRELFGRCQELALGEARTGYQVIASAFNQRLSGRFPFSRELPGPLDREADPADLRAFFRVFDAQAPALEAMEEGDPRFGDQEEEIRAFLKRMHKVRELFALFLDDPKRPEVPAFDFEVDFRTNTRHEQGGNQIIRWEMTAGDDHLVRWSAPELRARWSLGEPVRLALQWAKDAEDMPLPSAGRPADPRMKVEGRFVTYAYGGRWSLFSLLRDRAAEETDFEGGDDPHPQTLRFAIDTGPAPAVPQEGEEEEQAREKDKKKGAAPPERTGQVKIFVRVTLLAVEKKDKEETRKEVELPDFPTRAPIPGAQVAGSDEAEDRGRSR